MSALRRFSVFAGSVTALVVAGVSGSAAASSPPPPHPGSSWKTVAPAKVGLNGKVLKGIAQTAKQGKSNCLVVVRDGKLAGEWYFRGTNRNTTQDVYSVSKSVSSTLVGIAQDEGKLKVGDSASRWIPAWRGGPAAAVNVRDLLSMDSGRQWSFLTDYVQFLRAANRTAFAVGLPQQHAPGQVWAYNNAAVQTLQPVLQAATGREVTAFAAAKLFRPLGMTRTRMTTDKAGNAQTFEGVQSTCRDMARFGVMMLGRGRWGSASDRLQRLDQAGDRPVLDPAQRRLRVPVVAQPLRRAGESRVGHEPGRGDEPDHEEGAHRPRRARRSVLGVGARQPGRAGRPGVRDRRRPTRHAGGGSRAADVRAGAGVQGRHRSGRAQAPLNPYESLSSL
jgi:CubicO group peptidase (beta-lactamase class C family)